VTFHKDQKGDEITLRRGSTVVGVKRSHQTFRGGSRLIKVDLGESFASHWVTETSLRLLAKTLRGAVFPSRGLGLGGYRQVKGGTLAVLQRQPVVAIGLNNDCKART